MKKTIVYIDGFNLYYRLKQTPYRWLNLQNLSEAYLPPEQHNIIQIKYFTALVKGKYEFYKVKLILLVSILNYTGYY